MVTLSVIAMSEFECPQCGNVFDTKGGMNIHRSKVHEVPYKDKETLQFLYHKRGLSQEKIGKRFGVSQNAIKEQMQKHDIDTRKFYGDPTKPPHHSFRERSERPIGTCEEGVETRAGGDHVYVKIHRLIAYAYDMMDFDELADPEVKVHHKSGHGWDNRPSNLEVVDQETHRKRHAGSSYRTNNDNDDK